MVRASLESITRQIDERFEVIVVDNLSDNGSEKILGEYAAKGAIRVYRAKSSRGRARQMAFKLSSGRYVISNMDLDDTFQPTLPQLLELYIKEYDGKVVRIKQSPHEGDLIGSSVTVASRTVLGELRGWRDLQWFEDVDLWDRAKKESLFVEITYPLLMSRSTHSERGGLFGKTRYRYVVDREKMRLNYPTVLTLKKSPQYLLSWLSAKIMGEPRYIAFDDISNVGTGNDD
jgi:glycosyltransferase involved in cell wall biosynthesis